MFLHLIFQIFILLLFQKYVKSLNCHTCHKMLFQSSQSSWKFEFLYIIQTKLFYFKCIIFFFIHNILFFKFYYTLELYCKRFYLRLLFFCHIFILYICCYYYFHFLCVFYLVECFHRNEFNPLIGMIFTDFGPIKGKREYGSRPS